MNERCNSHPILGTAKIIFAVPTALTAALVLTAPGPAAAQPGWVLSHQKISDTQGGFPPGELDDEDLFGWSAAALSDLDGDGVVDLAVGAPLHDDGGTDRGAVWVLFLNTDGTVKSHQKISDTQGGFTGILDDDDWFGWSVASLGDLDGDGVTDLAVGAIYDDDGGIGRGAVWVLFLNTDGTVKSHQKISDTEGGFTGVLDDGDLFGSSMASLGDLDGDGVGDLAVGAIQDDDGGQDHGAAWVLFLDGVPGCGDGVCKSGEDQCNCPSDCGPPPDSETNCTDGIDEDCDGDTDCDDADCVADPACQPPACDGDDVCEPGEDCDTCPNDCDSKQNGKPSGRYCCGNGVQEGPEGNGICDGNP